DGDGFESIIKAKLADYSNPDLRTKVVKSIRSYHLSFESVTTAVNDNLTKLSQDNSVAVVTGQQVGMLGGPLYTLYKSFHTVILAKKYSVLYPQYSFVPIFWQETEDHDFQEVRAVNVVGNDFQLKNIAYTPSSPIEKVQVGGLKFETEALATFFAELKAALPKTDFSDSIFELYERCYNSEVTFAQAQAALLMALFAEEGLLIINANTRELKSFAAPLFTKEITNTPALSEAIVKQSEFLSVNYHAQIDAKGINLFLATAGKRMKLQQDGDSIKAGDSSFSKEELLAIIQNEPERLSMNVVMRPLVQDTILPTVSYVAGPGEIAYFAQLQAAYNWAGLQMPRIVPRITFTLIEERFEKLVDTSGTSIDALLEHSNDLVRELLTTEQEQKLALTFETTTEAIENSIEGLRNLVETTDPSLATSLTTLKGKIASQVRDFSAKTLGAERKKQQTTKQQFDKALTVLLPQGKLQERELNLVYFLNKYGMSFLSNLKNYLLTETFDPKEHLLLSIKSILPPK
ncbi:MAG TPA: bacillithiol biosynthesis cysteine-adding enzyme BshC, partial [Candidatus Kapabacteria bacterium]|nr:bacillithiol biosynthesis cysteine-adding enzyme BshC [Candidatus Kapabacteria bacterium]